MKIKIVALHFENFKGAKNQTINALSERVQISGANGSGKTTISDGWAWLISGKDSTGSAVFEIKTTDESGQAIPRIPHTVAAVLEVDGKELRISRTLTEKWVKSRGQSEAVFSGHETALNGTDYQRPKRISRPNYPNYSPPNCSEP